MTGDALTRVDYLDRFVIAVPEPMDATRFCALILQAAPRWLDLLLSVRDSVAGRFGFSTQERNYGSAVHLRPGAKFGPLVVLSVSSKQVVCGHTDTRLAVRATFETYPAPPRGSLTTEVEFKDGIGRAYFLLVKPFHKRIIPMLVAAPFPARASAEPHPVTTT